MGQILGVDYGERRIGLAISDQTKSIAFPYKVIKNENLKIKEQKISTTSKIILETPRKKVDEILEKLNSNHKLEANIL